MDIFLTSSEQICLHVKYHGLTIKRKLAIIGKLL